MAKQEIATGTVLMGFLKWRNRGLELAAEPVPTTGEARLKIDIRCLNKKPGRITQNLASPAGP